MSAVNVAVIAAERGSFVRAAPLLVELAGRADCHAQFIFAGEDYVNNANSDLFRDVRMPYADMVIGATEGTTAQRLAKVMAGCERLASNRPSGAVVLVGASHVILGCAAACARSRLVVARVDAGLRAPGIAGRTSLAAQIDRLCHLRFPASEQARHSLLDEGAAEETVVPAGALCCDAIAGCIERARAESALPALGLESKGYALVIVESPDNIEHLPNLRKFVNMLVAVHDHLPVALSMHRPLLRRLDRWEFSETLAGLPRLCNVEPRGYADYLSLLDSARVVLTDVGGVQDEAMFLGVPCLTLAETTDRAATVDLSGNLLIGLDEARALQVVEGLARNEYAKPPLPALWDGHASARIADAIVEAVARKGAA